MYSVSEFHIGEQIPRNGNRFSRALGRCLMRMLGGWGVEGSLPNEPKLIAAAGPHTSNWDFVVAMPVVMALGVKISYLGKHTLFIPPFHYFFKSLGGIPVNRQQNNGVVDVMAKSFRDNERLILGMAPEGTRGKVNQLRSGFLHISRATQVPVVLIGWDFERKVLVFGPLIPPSDDIDAGLRVAEEFFARMKGKNPPSTRCRL